MATRSYTETNLRLFGMLLVEWTGLLNGDDGSPYRAPVHADKTAQTTGTFGAGGSVALQGSNDPAAASGNFAVLHRADGAAPDANMADAEPITPLENPLWIRPLVTAGDGTTSLTLRVLFRKD